MTSAARHFIWSWSIVLADSAVEVLPIGRQKLVIEFSPPASKLFHAVAPHGCACLLRQNLQIVAGERDYPLDRGANIIGVSLDKPTVVPFDNEFFRAVKTPRNNHRQPAATACRMAREKIS